MQDIREDAGGKLGASTAKKYCCTLNRDFTREASVDTGSLQRTVCSSSSSPSPFPMAGDKHGIHREQKQQALTCSGRSGSPAVCCEWNEGLAIQRYRRAHAGSKWIALGPRSRAESRRPCPLERLETLTLLSPV